MLPLLALPFVLLAQIPVPAPEQTKGIVIEGGTIHTGNGMVIESGMTIFSAGKLLYVGIQSDDSVNRYLSSGYEVISAEGKHIYPGLIAMNTIVGLTEIDAVRASRDFTEVGEYNPHVRAVIAYNPESKIIPTLKHNGILLVQSVPAGGVISGRSALMQLDAWNWEDATHTAETGIHLHWPISVPGKEEEIMSKVIGIKTFFEEARAYAKGSSNVVNLRFEAMKGLFNGDTKLYIHANDYQSISAAVSFGGSFNLKVVIVGGQDSWKLTKILRENDVSVILTRVHRLPVTSDEAYDQPYRTPSILQDSGVLFCITDINAWQQRNIPFQAGTAVAFGLTKEEALAAVSLNPARILGVESTLGSLEKGKAATLVVSDGDLLDMRSNNISMAFIDGRKLDLTNSQQLLYERYSEKYRTAD